MIRGTQRPIVKVPIKASIHNRFDIEVVNVETGVVKQKAVAYNVICRQLWEKLLTPNSYFNYIHYGTGTGSPSESDTSLFAYLGGAAVTHQSQSCDENTGIGYVKRYIQINPETAVGKTITEVGVAHSSGSSSLCTQAMLKDMNGNPVSIEKTATDLINVYATIYCIFNPEGYENGSVFMCGSDEDLRFMKSICGVYSGDYWPNYAFGTRAWGMYSEELVPYSDGVGITKTYATTNKTMKLTMTRMDVNSNNLVSGGMTGVMIAGYRTGSSSSYPSMSCPCIFLLAGVENGWFPPYAIQGESVGIGDGVTSVYSTKFPYAKYATVYVDGVAQTTGVTITPGLNECSFPNNYVSAIKSISRPGKIIPSGRDIGEYRRFSTWQSHDGMYVTTGSWRYFYNPNYETVPVTNIYAPYAYVEASTDMENWVQVLTFTDTSTKAVPDAYQNYPFWREKRTQDYSPSWGYDNHYGSFTMPATTGNIIFDTPPTEGAVITIDYTTSVIPKDTNHVLDVEVTIHFGELTE